MSSTRTVYVVPATAGTGKSLVTLGLLDVMRSHADSLAFLRPLAATGPDEDPDDDPLLALVRRRPGITAARGAISRAEARSLLAQGRRAEVHRRCVATWSELAAQADVVIVDGSDFEDGRDLGVEFDLNVELANHLGAVVVAVVGASGHEVATTVESVDLARK